MASRKPPSQRDPLSRLSQAVRAGGPASMGGRVANAAPVKAAIPNRTVDALRLPSVADAGVGLFSSSTSAINVGFTQVSDPGFRSGQASLSCEVTAPAGTIVTMQGAAPGSPETRVDGAVFGSGSIYKVRTAAGAVVASPAQWNWGDWTYSAALSGAEWVGSDATTADFAFSATNGVTLILGGTYRFSVGIYLP